MKQKLDMIQKIDKVKTSEQVFQQLKDNIINEVWKRGEKIPSEVELSKAFNVSRNTVRAGLQRLSATGLLVVKHGEGSMVSDSAYDNSSLKPMPVIPMHGEEILDLIEFRCAIEGAFIQLAAQRREEEDLIELEKCIRECSEATAKGLKERQSLWDMKFHICLAKASKNKTYYSVVVKMKDIWLAQMMTSAKFLWNNSKKDYHALIYQAVAQKDGKKAARYLEQHLKHHLTVMISQIKEHEKLLDT